ncbi:MAG: hypothetical protein H7Y01_09915 [Ferruginibacter sp.]|nr:hypothetical protein [Chitinophagaceae bacterium]
MKQFKLPALIIFSLLTTNSFAQQTKIEVKKGQKYQVETTNKTTGTAEVMGQSMESTSDTKSTTVYEVLDVDATETKLESKLIKMVSSSSTMGQNMSYDSDKKDNEGPMSEAMSKLINKPRTVKLDNKGTITKQDAPEEVLPGMTGGSGGNESAIELFIPALIGKELKIGESYPDISEVKSEKLNSRDSGTYKVTAIANGVASISYTGKQVVSIQMEQMGMEMSSNGNNT